MIRTFLVDASYRKQWFSSILDSHFTNVTYIARYLGVSPRTVRDWIRGKYSLPRDCFIKLSAILPYTDIVDHIDEKELKSLAGRLGGLKRAPYFNPMNVGDRESRSRGGKASIISHNKMIGPTKFRIRKYCIPIEWNKEVAELIGIVIGDGHVSCNRVEITLDIREKQYAEYVQALITKVTSFTVTLKERKNSIISLYVNGRALSLEIQKLGVVSGNKTQKQHTIPNWIRNDVAYTQAFLRGIFDTDGSIYREKHTTRTKTYFYQVVAFTNYNKRFRQSIAKLLETLGFHPTLSTKHRIIVRRQREVQRFIQEISPANCKHTISL